MEAYSDEELFKASEYIETDDDHDRERAFRTLYSMYDHVNMLDLNHNRMKRLYTGEGGYSFDINKYREYIEDFAKRYIHPDDVEVYKEAVEAVLCGNAEMRPLCYRARKTDGTHALLSTRGFVLSDREGNPEYFGGIIIPH